MRTGKKRMQINNGDGSCYSGERNRRTKADIFLLNITNSFNPLYLGYIIITLIETLYAKREPDLRTQTSNAYEYLSLNTCYTWSQLVLLIRFEGH